ncbi:hypothetical protein Leryth_018592 [Lithospermum erythrorhizon]|nr:hypothetical protein Leryth_018592 [Lithospermum erythrorhizon]
MRATTRAAVHGTKAPLPDLLDKKQVEMEIGKLKEERVRKMKKLEEIVDSQLSTSKILSNSRILKLT